MTPELISQWAREAGSVYATDTWAFSLSTNQLQAFAAKVAAHAAAHEREMCARVCDGVSSHHYSFLEAEVAEDCAAAIRAKSASRN